jgi:hypothetical protein
MEQVGSTSAPPVRPDRPPASVTQPDWKPPVRAEAARRASSTSVSSAAHRRRGGLEVAAPLLQAYRTAALLVSSDCHLPVSLLAAIGQVESGNLQGRSLDARHRVVPRVRGPVLDGHHFARVPDTDGGVLDGDRTWDRAVGPMQFLPATWIAYAVDLDGDGRLDPQDVEDAAGSAAVYLCQSGGDLGEPASLRKAVLTYNRSRAYLRLVLAWMAAYDDAGLTEGSGLATLPAVLLDPGAARMVAPAAGASVPGQTRVRRSTSEKSGKHGKTGKAAVAVEPVKTKPGGTSTSPGRDPVRPGKGWTPDPEEPGTPPDDELPQCVPDPVTGQPLDPVTGLPVDPVTGLPVTDPPTTDPPASDPPASDPPATEPPSTDPSTEPAPDPTDPAPDPSDPPLESCEPPAPGDPVPPVDPATETDPDDPQPEPCAPCAP